MEHDGEMNSVIDASYGSFVAEAIEPERLDRQMPPVMHEHIATRRNRLEATGPLPMLR